MFPKHVTLIFKQREENDVRVDSKEIAGRTLPDVRDGKEHVIEVLMGKQGD
jgi:hypothetical protein